MEALGDYIIQKELEAGPFGTVYLAQHRFIKKLFALKELPKDICNDPSFIRRIETQIAQIAELNHPHILKIHNVSFQEGKYFIVTDAILDSLSEIHHIDRFLELYGKSLQEEQIEELLRQIASALDYAHAEKMVHGSLKPTNIFVVVEEKGFKVQIADFGLNRLIGEKKCLLKLLDALSSSIDFTEHAHEKISTLQRQFVQSFYFLAPEQKWISFTLTDPKVDAYAFGILAYFLLMRKIPEGQFDPPSKGYPDSQKNWDLLISRCLQNNPMLRPQRLLLALSEYLQAPKTISHEMVPIMDVQSSIDNVQQMAFSFQTVEKDTNEEILKPVLKTSEIERPEFEQDPGAIFQRETTVSHYTPKQATILEVEPILTEMVVIPGGNYMRGSFDGARDEMPRHQVKLASFALDIHPVTNEQFVRFLQVMGGEKDHNNNDIIRLRDSRIKRSGGKIIIEFGYSKHPVVGVTWYGAIAYAKWVGKRLPTEAEWEAASTSGRADFLYPTGADIERTQANFFSSDTTPVMSYPPNGFGLYDTAGNVYQWCQDWYAYNYYDISSIEPDFPTGPNQGVYRVLRGGCWKSLKEDMRSSHRHRNNPGAVNSTYGFRLAADVV